MSKPVFTHGATDVGQKRRSNQDQFLIAEIDSATTARQGSHALKNGDAKAAAGPTVLLVADGMGGHQAGARASELVVEGVMDYLNGHLPFFRRDAIGGDDSFGKHLFDALLHCRELLVREAARSPECRGMGTTATLAVIHWPRLFIAHAGDSRCYRLRDGQLQQLTRDHTLSQLYKESQDERGMDVSVQEEERLNNTLWNVISDSEKLEPEVGRFALEDDDQILLCSDGLFKDLTEKRIVAALTATMDPETACRKLIDDANLMGGSDNITAVIARRVLIPPPRRTHSPLADTVEYDGDKTPPDD